ncbi:putative F-box protein At1g49610 [Lycium ferocissimum]|uniref:putative F-box protein At1g49610 n=1 Tax=Lycium ferocissimum TaxID=112874 RepID=UPI0028154B12|nr:putative F-box protein At1g49610 [Lycium ferocissimum]
MGDQDQSPGSSVDVGGLILENPPQKNVKIETETGSIDWISKLPDALIVRILSLLPITDACKTTILSKRWQNLWTCIHNFIYNQKHDYSDSSTVNKFISFIDNVLPLLNCSSFKRFHLEFSFNYDDGMSYGPKIDELLEFAVNKNVEELHLNTWYIHEVAEYDLSYSLPQVLCSSSSILKIECMDCRISEDCVLNWTSLKSLSLGYLYLRDEQIEQIMSNCPQLESLQLCGFCIFHRLHITSPKCRRLELIDHAHSDGDWGSLEDPCGACCFEIVAPYVQHLEISGNFDRTEIRLEDLSSLIHADLTFYQDDVICETIAEDLLVSVRFANELTISSWFIKVISDLMLEEEDVSLPELECKWLTISSCIPKGSFPGIDNLLRSTPYLENLMMFPDTLYKKCFWWEDIDLLGDSYLSLQENIFKVSLQNLKNIKVISPFGSCCPRADTTELPQFLKFLLEHAMNLEKLVIEPPHKGCNICSTNISKLRKNLLAFPRTSNSAVVSLG